MTDYCEKYNSSGCAPGKEHINGSCFSEKDIREMVKSYNTYHKAIIINPERMKMRELLIELLEKTECGRDEKCLIKSRFMSALKISNLRLYNMLTKYTFRPEGPKECCEWLSNFDIMDVIKQYEFVHSDFKLLGVVPIDFYKLDAYVISDNNFDLDTISKTYDKIAVVFNLDYSSGNGTHWTSLFCNLKTNELYYFDSVGDYPIYGQHDKPYIIDFMKKITLWILKNTGVNVNEVNDLFEYIKKNKIYVDNKNYVNGVQRNEYKSYPIKIMINRSPHQNGSSECGVYSLNTIIRLLEGESFEEIIRMKLTDSQVQKCRKTYFS